MDAPHELMTRKGHGAGADTRPYVVVADELPECLRVLNGHDCGLLQSALELIGGLSGRKHAVSVITLGQSWSKAVVGSTAMRNLITSSAVFRMRSDEAFYMINLKSRYWRVAGPDPLDLEPGHVLRRGHRQRCGVGAGSRAAACNAGARALEPLWATEAAASPRVKRLPK